MTCLGELMPHEHPQDHLETISRRQTALLKTGVHDLFGVFAIHEPYRKDCSIQENPFHTDETP